MTVPSFPSLVPSGRSFDPGDLPIKTYNAQNGAEVRIVYGSKRINRKLQLVYANIPDKDAEKFIKHYGDASGTLNQFSVPSTALKGWEGIEAQNVMAVESGLDYRYARPPQMTQVAKGKSTVTVDLVMVTKSTG